MTFRLEIEVVVAFLLIVLSILLAQWYHKRHNSPNINDKGEETDIQTDDSIFLSNSIIGNNVYIEF